MLEANCRKSLRNNAYLKRNFPQLTSLSKLTRVIIFLLLGVGLEQFSADSVERITSWFHYFLWTFSLGIAQLSKYNCHMLIRFGSVGILGKTPMLVVCGLADYVGQGCGF